jgi:2-amino-4-hydroxy-6-hydroxymethyldihydropteridine diphosphokinase
MVSLLKVRYFIGLGANLGDRLATLRGAADKLATFGQVVARSRVFASAPVGGPPQPPFLNAGLTLDCDLEPLEMLDRCQAIELELGRARADMRWGPRTIDLDLLLAGTQGQLIFNHPRLRLPHPRMKERGFALAPLIDLDPTLIHPQLGRPLTALVPVAHEQGQVWAPTGEWL